MIDTKTEEGLKRVIGVPGVALTIVNYTIGAGIFVFSVLGGFQQLAVLASSSILIIYLTVILATVQLRTKEQDISEKTFRMPGGLIIPLIGIAAIVWLLTGLGKWEILSTLIFVAIVLAIYFLTIEFREKGVVGSLEKLEE
ncbi:hypothetical protein K8352_00735 [Flavobacteriaceae bacterium F89]|uniref:Amino acid permease n=1 Tax=Cerina litoralis TaxID=2874477 RepID=A0AAE3ET76_9FLAO|nr:hypothetical protein [Cerina litoralis]MCG2459266.1 hypothetical protein [Cerina litoralis]